MVSTRASKAKRPARNVKKTSKRQRPSGFGAPKKARRTEQERNAAENIAVPGGKIPPWQTLPYSIVLSIFKNASYPLMNDAFNMNPSASWLVKSASVCKVFCEPALSALYDSPPLVHHGHVRALSGLVRREDAKALDYGRKIRQLNVHLELMRFGETRGDFENLIPYLSGLKGIAFFTYADSLRQETQRTGLSRLIRDPQLSWIDALRKGEIALTRLRLNGRLLHQQVPGPERLLLNDVFDYLTDLTLVSVNYSDFAKMVTVNTLGAMKFLSSLAFVKCTLVTGQKTADNDTEDSILYHLPSSLAKLTFIQCIGLDSEGLHRCLSSAGGKLISLELRHNDSLNLRFMCNLASTCPILENIAYDLTLFSPFMASVHHEPDFNELLAAEDVPEWPSTMQEIEMVQLRHWETKAAEAFFKSLMFSAVDLPMLRRIHITASIGAGWRERASFRENIIGPIHKVFKKPWSEPDPNRKSLKAAPQTEFQEKTSGDAQRDLDRNRRSARLSKSKRETTILGSGTSRRAQVTGRATRGQKEAASRQTRDITVDTDMEEEPLFVQGSCEHVYIRVDNIRPSEDQLNEDDFLDSERSGDEAWDPAKGDPDDD